MRKLHLLIIFLAITTFCFGQNTYSFSIEQVNTLGSDRNKYIYKDYKLSVFQNSNSLQSIVLSEKQKQILDSIISRIENEHLKDKYKRTSIIIIVDGISKKNELIISDGIYWYFKYKFKENEKSIFLDNYYLKSADILVSYLNTLLDKQYQIISFGDNLNLKSDTIVYYLPEFLNENLVLQDTNFRITDITCYKKGYLGTEILDSMIQCKCRISPKNEFYATKYWEVCRLDDRNWKREYYDNDGHIYKVEYFREILPFEIVHEVIEVYEGLKPSVIIKNYYKTEIINKKE